MNELLIENRGAVRILTMNRPEKHNALNTALTTSLLNQLTEAGNDAACRAIVLAGAGKSFCAGADVNEFSALSSGDAVATNARADLTASLHAVFWRISKPIIAAAKGNTLGGGAGLALACDMVIAAHDIRFGYPEMKHGIVPAIVMGNLVRQLGRKKAFELVSTFRMLDGHEMAFLGLANAVVEEGSGDVLERAVELAQQMAACSPVAMSATKNLFYRVCDLPLAEAIATGRDTNVIMRGFPKPPEIAH